MKPCSPKALYLVQDSCLASSVSSICNHDNNRVFLYSENHSASTYVSVCLSLVLLQGIGDTTSHEMVIPLFDVPTKCDHCTLFVQVQVRQGMTCEDGLWRRESAGQGRDWELFRVLLGG